MTDDDLIFKLYIKDEEGLTELIDQYAGLLKSVIIRHLYALPHYQEDCLNDVLFAIWENIDQYDKNKASFKNWICAIARYRAINCLKKYQHELTTMPIENQSPVSTTDKPFEKELWEIQLDELLAPLSAKDRAIFQELAESNTPSEEIAAKHGLSRGALYNRVSRAKNKLRHFFQKEGAKQNEK
ncbi:sigma-70 family RNA polymerase sigma factor [Jeotgalibaca sp. A127]|uniref:sigma-70 family RNA polymerase sigma factor n=1 Tax=Jeotgalibaca sp. A127 TaxID=3457324 RepID=UPI003FD2AFC7